MYYARWAEKEEMKEVLKEVKKNEPVQRAGVPILYEEGAVYIKENAHTLVIGSMGSGKTQAVTLPLCHLAREAGESFVVHDSTGELYRKLACQFEKENYKVLAIDFGDPEWGEGFNPLTLPYILYKRGEKDKAVELISSIGYYMVTTKNDHGDPFWNRSAISCFTGLALYLFENAREEEVNINSLFTLTTEISIDKNSLSKEIMDSLDKTSNIYVQLSSILLAPPETKGSILSVLTQAMKKFVTREKLSKMLSKSTFDIEKVGREKTAIFVITGMKGYASYLTPLFLEQVFQSVDLFGTHEKNMHMILDGFESMLPIHHFDKILQYARHIPMPFTVMIPDFMELKNTYGKENTEIMKLCFENILYLLSGDIDTLAEISKMCGTHLVENQVVPLISVEELKTLSYFEGIVLMTRMMPFKTKLIPDYQMDQSIEKEKELQELPTCEIQIFDIQKKLENL